MWVLPVAGHTMTVAEEKLVIIGGISATNYFNENVYVINTNSLHKKWENHDSETRTNSKPTGMVTAVLCL